LTTEVVAPAHGDIDTVVVREVTLPAPGPGQILLSVRAVGVNPTDWKSMHRAWPRQAPLLIGYEAAGVVAAVGRDSDKNPSSRWVTRSSPIRYAARMPPT
jgi:NADPH:quinone reductase